MTERPPSRRPDDWVAPLLRAEAERHDPDDARILATVRAGMAPGRDVGRDPRRAGGDRVGGEQRRPWLVPAAAAAAVLLVAGVTVGLLSGGSGGAPVATGTPSTTTGAPGTAPTGTLGTTGLSGTRGGSVTGPAGTLTPPVGGTSPGSGGTSGGPAPTGGATSAGTAEPTGGPSVGEAVTVTVSVGAAKPQVTLGPTMREWAGFGLRKDGVTVRTKAGAGLIETPFTFGGATSAVEQGPFRVSWSGGVPEQDRVDAATWFVARRAQPGVVTGLTLQATAVPAGTFTVYCGSIGSRGRAEVVVDGRSAAALPLPVGAGQVEVVLKRPVGSVQVKLVAGADGGVGLAAAVLR